MACLFVCFRTKDDKSTSTSVSVSQVKSKRVHDSKNHLSALFLSEEKAAVSSPCHNTKGSTLKSMHIDNDLMDETQVIKACGPIQAIPNETRKASKILETSQRGKHLGSPPSLISSSSNEVFQLDETKNEPFEDMERSLDISEQSPNSCLTDARNNARISSASSDASEESIGTTFRHELDKVPHKDKVQASKEKTEDESPTSTVCEGRLKESSVENIHIDETTSSHSVMQSKKKSNKNMEAFKITLGDRPIIGMVSAQWNEKEKSQISHKWWDGNGIPNSTNKYKEDQKVSWHVTSFEERLEKALLEEGNLE